jgi:hypothetical protein
MTNARTLLSNNPAAGPSRRWRTGAALVSLGLLVGCGGSDGGAFDDFVGLWIPDPATPPAMQTAQITCTTQTIDESAFVWTSMLFERGVLTDLNELGPCLISYDVTGNVATPSNPDPYDPMARPQGCTTGTERPNGDPSAVNVPPSSASSWTFTLVDSSAGMAPRADLVIAIPTGAAFAFIDPVTMQVAEATPCSYNVVFRFIKLTKS